MIRLIGPGGAGKSSTGALLAERLGVSFLDLDNIFSDRIGDIGAYIDRQGYEAYAHGNVSTYFDILHSHKNLGVLALSSGFMTYSEDIHPEYSQTRTEIAQSPTTFVLLPSLDLKTCVAEIVCRQIGRPFGRSPAREEAVIRARFPSYLSLPALKIQTMCAIVDVADEIIGALPPNPKVWLCPIADQPNR